MKTDRAVPQRSAPLSGSLDQPIVAIVDDDEAVREALSELVLSAGLIPLAVS